ncbi:hypothetical protein [Sandarakinorhabdus sp.]|uniref:hypothetical protein n=1 Tax=Sandarakinorhabdus sp. TaxID=1916663 RepID=UPI00356A742A
MSKRQGQNAGVAQNSEFRGDQLACFDLLPAALRAAHHEAVVRWCSLKDRWHLNKAIKAGVPYDVAVAALVAATKRADAAEVVMFSRALPRIFKGQSPHVAAGASVQPYGRRGDTRATLKQETGA